MKALLLFTAGLGMCFAMFVLILATPDHPDQRDAAHFNRAGCQTK